MDEYKCKLCENVEFNKYMSLSRHMSIIHNIKIDQFYVDYYLNGEWPLCKCGCGIRTRWSYGLKGFRTYAKGHSCRVHNNWGHNPKAIANSAKTRREQYANGEREPWCKGLTKYTSEILARSADKISSNKIRAERISVALTGMRKTDEHIRKITEDRKKYWSDPKHREEQSHRRMLYMKRSGREIISNLELEFAHVLDELKIHYHQQHYIREIKGLFDFFINDKLFVEIMGDFWHCKPGTKFEIPKYECQIQNLEMDKTKEEWCRKNGIRLLKIWESDWKINRSSEIQLFLNEIKTPHL